MQHARAQDGIEMSLREHLMAASNASGSAPSPYPPASSSAPQGSDNPYPPSDSQSPHDHQIDPNVAGQPLSYAMSGGALIDPNDDRKGKRELSTSKRAAQNRAAQRAFRQRKEGYIKKLEEQVKEAQTLEHNFKALQNENYQLREYVLSLQSRLLENQTEFPPAPAHATLSTTASSAPSQHTPASDAPPYGAEQQLRREMEQQRPPPAPVVAREDASYSDGISQLQQAAASADGRPAHSSPYGLGNDYSGRRPQGEPNQPPSTDAKPPN